MGHKEGFPVYADFIGACGGGVVVRESKFGKVAEKELEEQLRTFFKNLQPEIELARKHGVRLAIENHSDALLDSLESIRMFTRLNPAPEVVGIALAPYHLQVSKVPVVEAIRTSSKQLFFLYAWQRQKGVLQLPGHGSTDFAPWLQALAEQNYGHWMTPFMHGDLPVAEMAAAVTKARRYLEQQAAAPGGTDQPNQ
jgi:sugar phosphate isomerase/epimerase